MDDCQIQLNLPMDDHPLWVQHKMYDRQIQLNLPMDDPPLRIQHKMDDCQIRLNLPMDDRHFGLFPLGRPKKTGRATRARERGRERKAKLPCGRASLASPIAHCRFHECERASPGVVANAPA